MEVLIGLFWTHKLFLSIEGILRLSHRADDLIVQDNLLYKSYVGHLRVELNPKQKLKLIIIIAANNYLVHCIAAIKILQFWVHCTGELGYKRRWNSKILRKFLFLFNSLSSVLVCLWQRGCWECHLKYIGQKCFSYFHSIQQTNRGQMTIVA